MSLKCYEWINLFLGSCSCWSGAIPYISARWSTSWAGSASKVNLNGFLGCFSVISCSCDAALTECTAFLTWHKKKKSIAVSCLQPFWYIRAEVREALMSIWTLTLLYSRDRKIDSMRVYCDQGKVLMCVIVGNHFTVINNLTWIGILKKAAIQGCGFFHQFIFILAFYFGRNNKRIQISVCTFHLSSDQSRFFFCPNSLDHLGDCNKNIELKDDISSFVITSPFIKTCATRVSYLTLK